jgi:hypothetical protein
MAKGTTGFALSTMAFLAVAVALHAMRYDLVPWNIWLGVDSAIQGVFARTPITMIAHTVVAPFALLLGPFQFFPGLRSRRPTLHRWSGRIYVVAVLVSGPAALFSAPFASGGPVAGAGFAALATAWLLTTTAAWRAAVARQIPLHRILMRFSYAMTFGAVTLRLQIPLGFIFFHFTSYREMSVWLAYTSWIPNVIVVAIYSLLAGLRRERTPAVAAA